MSYNTLNFKEALNLLEEISSESTFKLDLISTKIPLELKDLNSYHIKLLYNNLTDNLTFEKTFLNVLTDIVKDKNLNCQELSIIDSASIALKLRQRMSEKMMCNFLEIKTNQEEEVSEEEFFQFEINLAEFYEEIYSNLRKASDIIEGKILKYQDLTIELKIPTISSYLSEDPTDKSSSSFELETYLKECTRYISGVYFKENVIKFHTSNINENLKLLELLPAGILQELTDKILNFKNEITKSLTIEIIKNDKKYQTVLGIDSSLFFAD